MNILIILTAKYAFLISIAGYLVYAVFLWKVDKKVLKMLLFVSVISFPLAFIIAKLSSFVLFDPRPFIVERVAPLIPHAADNGFPSDHTLLTMAIASVVFAFNKKLGSVLFIIALCVGTARVLAKVHHPLDIIGAAIIAIGSSALVYILLPYVLKILRPMNE